SPKRGHQDRIRRPLTCSIVARSRTRDQALSASPPRICPILDPHVDPAEAFVIIVKIDTRGFHGGDCAELAHLPLRHGVGDLALRAARPSVSPPPPGRSGRRTQRKSRSTRGQRTLRCAHATQRLCKAGNRRLIITDAWP